jgi:hypothetical protein
MPAARTTEATAAETAPRSGEYVALANLSVSRARSDRGGGLGDDRMADRVEAGERVTLTDDEAHGFLTRHRIPVIRKASEQDSGRKITARDLFGRRTPAPLADKVESLRDSTQLVQVGEPAVLSPEGNAPDPADTDPDADNEGARSTARGKAARES